MRDERDERRARRARTEPAAGGRRQRQQARDAVDLEPPFGGMKLSGHGHPEGGEYIYSSLTALRAVYGS
ncbi:MAG: hypothetical protein J2P24_14265 [Streptosporangiales bacterium]|nr:hypothetical protein [Streptosporangiales bacterium]